MLRFECSDAVVVELPPRLRDTSEWVQTFYPSDPANTKEPNATEAVEHKLIVDKQVTNESPPDVLEESNIPFLPVTSRIVRIFYDLHDAAWEDRPLAIKEMVIPHHNIVHCTPQCFMDMMAGDCEELQTMCMDILDQPWVWKEFLTQLSPTLQELQHKVLFDTMQFRPIMALRFWVLRHAAFDMERLVPQPHLKYWRVWEALLCQPHSDVHIRTWLKWRVRIDWTIAPMLLERVHQSIPSLGKSTPEVLQYAMTCLTHPKYSLYDVVNHADAFTKDCIADDLFQDNVRHIIETAGPEEFACIDWSVVDKTADGWLWELLLHGLAHSPTLLQQMVDIYAQGRIKVTTIPTSGESFTTLNRIIMLPPIRGIRTSETPEGQPVGIITVPARTKFWDVDLPQPPACYFNYENISFRCCRNNTRGNVFVRPVEYLCAAAAPNNSQISYEEWTSFLAWFLYCLAKHRSPAPYKPDTIVSVLGDFTATSAHHRWEAKAKRADEGEETKEPDMTTAATIPKLPAVYIPSLQMVCPDQPQAMTMILFWWLAADVRVHFVDESHRHIHTTFRKHYFAPTMDLHPKEQAWCDAAKDKLQRVSTKFLRESQFKGLWRAARKAMVGTTIPSEWKWTTHVMTHAVNPTSLLKPCWLQYCSDLTAGGTEPAVGYKPRGMFGSPSLVEFSMFA